MGPYILRARAALSLTRGVDSWVILPLGWLHTHTTEERDAYRGEREREKLRDEAAKVSIPSPANVRTSRCKRVTDLFPFARFFYSSILLFFYFSERHVAGRLDRTRDTECKVTVLYMA